MSSYHWQVQAEGEEKKGRRDTSLILKDFDIPVHQATFWKLACFY